ncbi:MAG: hypothetical protein LBC42_03295 [Puniceicoccales bacterium]|jgi:hypothetical protein|nr:hypothetical protein [Puniceicoccales bacterium]
MSTGSLNLQNAIQALQRQMGISDVAPEEAVPETTVPFKPAKSLLPKDESQVLKRRERESAGAASDVQIERKKSQIATSHSAKMGDENGGPRYLNFVNQLRDNVMREPAEEIPDGGGMVAADQKEEGAAAGTDKEGLAEEEPAEGEEAKGETHDLASQETDLSAYPKELRNLLRMAMAESKSTAEQHNFLSCAKACVEEDIAAYASQQSAAESLLEQLQGKTDDVSKKKLKRTQNYLEANKKQMTSARSLRDQLQSLLGHMRKNDGRRIDDGYNLIPKASAVVAKMAPSAGVAGAELASNYREEVLTMKNSSDFFDNFMLKHRNVGFQKYIEMVEQLLGDDIRSINPSRSPEHLLSVRNAIFAACMSFQIFCNVHGADQKLRRIFNMRLKAAGIYELRTILIELTDDGMRLSLSLGRREPTFLKNIRINARSNHFAELSEIVYDNDIDGFIVPDCLEGWRREFRFAVTRRYGLPVERDLPIDWKMAHKAMS